MLKEILNLEGVAVLSKEQQKSVNGGMYWSNQNYSDSVCRVVCKDKTVYSTASCSDAPLICTGHGGTDTTNPDQPGPFDKPKMSFS
jgi:hypothetical protein